MRGIMYISLMAMLLPVGAQAQAEFSPTACSKATDCMVIEGVCPSHWKALHKADEASMRAHVQQLAMTSKCRHDYPYVAKPQVDCVASRCVQNHADVNNESVK